MYIDKEEVKAVAERKWVNDMSLRREFDNDFETFLAYETLRKQGRVKICGRNHSLGRK